MLRVLVWLVVCLLMPIAQAATPVAIDDRLQVLNLARHMEIYEDKSRTHSFDSLRALEDDIWRDHHGNDFRVGNSNSTFWFRMRLQGSLTLSAPRDMMIDLDAAFLPFVDFYTERNGEIDAHLTGIARPDSQRPSPVETFALPVRIKPGDMITLWMRVQNEGPVVVPPTLYGVDAFHAQRGTKALLLGSFFGLTLVLAFYNFFLYTAIRDSSYLVYSVNTLMMGWFQAALHGYTAHYVWNSGGERIAYIEAPVVLWLWFTSTLLFTRQFLSVDRRFPRLDRVFVGMMLVCIAMAFGSFFPPLYWVWQIYTLIQPLLIGLAIVAACYAYVQGVKAARFFLLGWGIFLSGGLITSFYYLGIVPSNIFTRYCVLFGSALEGILFSLALADRIHEIRNERNRARHDAIDALRSADETRDAFLIAVSHELRTPLNAIVGALELNRHEGERSRLEENDRIIESGARRMIGTVEDLLMLGRLDAGEWHVTRQPISPQEWLAPLIERIRMRCEDRQLTFRVCQTADTDRTWQVCTDALQLILEHLLDNAIRFTPNGGIELRLTWPDHDGAGWLDLSVQDTGPGMAEHELSTLQESFKQGSSGYRRSHEGLGLGLALCQRMIAQVGGELALRNRAEGGLEARVRLPVERDR